ncbi:hypothetical protein [Gordonia sp. N1V]|uniref:hypothetical protein n=1 Tax=Gordonia sp. N1V TaxID=3034163 RepID=UPI0023E1E64E|nr:hypothetical protein [Gordonia sp. N1V]MDF3282708.1 hypothetical protein [Gordonia sp. N1V]
MSSGRTTFPDLLLGPDDASWGDERERAVLLEGYAYTYTLSTLLLWALGAVAAWFVPAWVSVLWWVALIAPAMEWQRFCTARRVDPQTLVYARGSRRRIIVASLYTGACSLSMALAVILGLGPDGEATTIVGAVVGGIVGGGAAFLLARRHAIKSEKAQAAGDLDD